MSFFVKYHKSILDFDVQSLGAIGHSTSFGIPVVPVVEVRIATSS